MRKRTCTLIGILLLGIFPATAQNNKQIDSLEQLVLYASEQEQIPLLLELAKITQRIQLQKATEYLKKVETLLDTTQENAALEKYYVTVSRNKLYQHEYQASLALVEKALALTKQLTPLHLIHLYSTRGTCYYFQGEYEKAIQAHLNALRICDEESIALEKPQVFNNISVVYLGMDDWEKAEEYISKALELADEYNNTIEGSRARGNMAILFAQQAKYDLAEEWFIKDLEFDRSIGDLISVSKNHNNLGVLYEIQGDILKSLNSYQSGLKIAEQVNDRASIALGYQNVAIAQSKLKRYAEAIKSYEIGLKMSRSLGNRDILRDGLLGISELYEAKGDFKTALTYHQQYFLLNDSIINDKHRNSVSELEIKYESEKKEKEILVLSEQQRKNERSIARQRVWVQRLSVGLIAGTLFLVGLFIILRLRSNNQKQQALITAIADTQTAERKRIAQDLHDSIGGSLALAKTKLELLFDKQGQASTELKESLETLLKTSDQVRQISHDLMPGELVKFGLISAIQTTIDQLKDTELSTKLYEHNMKQRLDPTKEVQLFRIIQELIQNILKHAQAKNISIYLNKYKKHLSLMVEDDGIGMEPSLEKPEGMGLNNIKQRVGLLKGTLHIDSTPGQGTTLNIEIPI